MYSDYPTKLAELTGWETRQWAERWMAKAREFPVCQRCQKAWDKQASQ
jgi:hypothetical protein